MMKVRVIFTIKKNNMFTHPRVEHTADVYLKDVTLEDFLNMSFDDKEFTLQKSVEKTIERTDLLRDKYFVSTIKIKSWLV